MAEAHIDDAGVDWAQRYAELHEDFQQLQHDTRVLARAYELAAEKLQYQKECQEVLMDKYAEIRVRRMQMLLQVPANGMMLFMRETRKAARKLHPSATRRELKEHLAREWGKMVVEEQDTWNAKHQALYGPKQAPVEELKQPEKKLPTLQKRPSKTGARLAAKRKAPSGSPSSAALGTTSANSASGPGATTAVPASGTGAACVGETTKATVTGTKRASKATTEPKPKKPRKTPGSPSKARASPSKPKAAPKAARPKPATAAKPRAPKATKASTAKTTKAAKATAGAAASAAPAPVASTDSPGLAVKAAKPAVIKRTVTPRAKKLFGAKKKTNLKKGKTKEDVSAEESVDDDDDDDDEDEDEDDNEDESLSSAGGSGSDEDSDGTMAQLPMGAFG